MAISHADRVMPGVSVAGIPIGGMDRAAATETLEAGLPSLEAGTLTLQVDEVARTFPFADLNRSYDLEATVDAAFAVARSGNPLVDGVTRLRTLAHPTAVTGAGVVLDPAAVDQIVSDVVAAYDHPATDGSVSFRKKDGFVAAPAVEGVTVDAAALSAGTHRGAWSPPAAISRWTFRWRTRIRQSARATPWRRPSPPTG